MRFLECLCDRGKVGGDPRCRRWTGPVAGLGKDVAGLGKDDVDNWGGDALDERGRDPFGAEQEASEGCVVAGDGLRATLDRGLRPRRPRHGLGRERKVARRESGGHERARPTTSPEDGNLHACRLHSDLSYGY